MKSEDTDEEIFDLDDPQYNREKKSEPEDEDDSIFEI